MKNIFVSPNPKKQLSKKSPFLNIKNFKICFKKFLNGKQSDLDFRRHKFTKK